MFSHVIGNDPRPTCSTSRTWPRTASCTRSSTTAVHVQGLLKTTLEQPRLSQSGAIMQHQTRWQQLVRAEPSPVIQGGQVVVQSSVAAEVPLTGTTVGTAYGAHRSGWTNVGAGATTFNLADPGTRPHRRSAARRVRVRRSPRRTAPGTARDGSVHVPVAAPPRTAPAPRSRAPAAQTYTATPADAGFTMRVVVTASGLTAWRSAVSTETAPSSAGQHGRAQISGNLQERSDAARLQRHVERQRPITYTYEWHRCRGGTCVRSRAAGRLHAHGGRCRSDAEGSGHRDERCGFGRRRLGGDRGRRRRPGRAEPPLAHGHASAKRADGHGGLTPTP